MRHDPSRKRLLATMLGFGALGALAPRADAAAVGKASTNKEDGSAVAFRLRPLPGSVAGRGGAT